MKEDPDVPKLVFEYEGIVIYAGKSTQGGPLLELKIYWPPKTSKEEKPEDIRKKELKKIIQSYFADQLFEVDTVGTFRDELAEEPAVDGMFGHFRYDVGYDSTRSTVAHRLTLGQTFWFRLAGTGLGSAWIFIFWTSLEGSSRTLHTPVHGWIAVSG